MVRVWPLRSAAPVAVSWLAALAACRWVLPDPSGAAGGTGVASLAATNRMVLRMVEAQDGYEDARGEASMCNETRVDMRQAVVSTARMDVLNYASIATARGAWRDVHAKLSDAGRQTVTAGLRAALTGRDYKAVRAWVKGGANVLTRSYTEHRYTLLHVAAATGTPVMAMVYLGGVSAGVHVDATDAYGRTPLHVAAVHCRSSAAVGLMAVGADVFATDHEGYTPLVIARANRGCLATGAVLAAASAARLQGAEDLESARPVAYGLLRQLNATLPPTLAVDDIMALPWLAHLSLSARRKVARAYLTHAEPAAVDGRLPRHVVLALCVVSGGVAEPAEVLEQRLRRALGGRI